MSYLPYVITVVTPPSLLTHEILDLIEPCHTLKDAQWLSQQEAIDIKLFASGSAQAQPIFEKIQRALISQKADVFLISDITRKKKLLIADMDSTIVQSETLDDLAAEVGIGEQIAAITKRAMNGELIFADALNERIALLKNVPADLLEKTWQHTSLNKGAKTLVATMKKNHAYTALISGGFTFFTQKVADKCGFHENHANQLSIQDHKLDGTVIPPILGKEAKLFHLNRLTQMLKITQNDSMAIGDGANDLPMLTNAGLGIGYYPKQIVAQKIQNIIQHTSLRSALFIQGYHAHEFVD